MTAGRRRYDFAGDRRLIESFAHIPRMPLGLGRRLDVAPRQIKADGISENQAICRVDRNILTAGAQGDDHLHFVMQIGRQ